MTALLLWSCGALAQDQDKAHPSTLPTAGQTPGADAQTVSPACVAGLVLAAASGKPLVSANIGIAGTRMGAASQSDGTFFIGRIPPGSQTVVVSFLGYKLIEEAVELLPGETIHLTFHLEETIVGQIDPITVTAERPMIDVTKTSTAHTLHASDLEEMVTQTPTIDEVVAQQPGVIKDGDQLHFRGGRSDESLFIVDGVKVKDLLSGQSSGNEVSARAAQEVNVVTGGFEARFSQAMSGVIDTRLKEGTRHWRGALSYDTDALTDTKNLHHIYGELGGPNIPLAGLLRLLGNDHPSVTFFASLSTDFSDGYLPGIRDLHGNNKLRPSIEDRFLGTTFTYGHFFCPRASNSWRAIYKTAWKINADNKLAFSWTKTLTFMQDWGSPDIGDIDRNVNRFPWAWAQRMDHHYTISKDTNILSLIWNRTLGLNTRTSLQIWRCYMGRHSDVAGKNWLDYDYESKDSDLLPEDDTPYFVDVGDASRWQDQHVIVWGARNDWQYQAGRHAFSWGLSAEYHDVQYFRMDTRSINVGDPDPESPNYVPPDEERRLGTEFDLFHVTPNAGNLYAQDLFSYEGLATNLGFVCDYWFPGKQVERAMEAGTQPHMTPGLRRQYYEGTRELFGRRYKSHVSPRIGVSFPINERAHLFFSYGHYSQRPPYYYVYAKTNSQSGEEYPQLGNPALNAKISVQYELGTGYQFSDVAAAKATVFWKDMYDYPTGMRITLDERATRRSNFYMYWNMDYARSRGIEFSFRRRRQGFWSSSFSYTYSVAKGKSSDPNKSKLIQESGGDSRETDLGEEYLWWNRPHKLTARLSLKVKQREDPPIWLGLGLPGDFTADLYYMIRSGRPYTPINEFGEDTGDKLSENGPVDMTCDFILRKGFRIAGRRLEAALKIYNIFDYRNVRDFDHVTGEPYQLGKGELTSVTENPANLDLPDDELVAIYCDETGKDPSKEKAEEIRRFIISNVYKYSNPAYEGPPRTIRIGLSYAW